MQQIIDSSFAHLKRHLYQQNLTILSGGIIVLVLTGLLLMGLQYVLLQEKTNLQADFTAHVNYMRKQEQLLLQFNHQNSRVWGLLQHEANLPPVKPQFIEFPQFTTNIQFTWQIPSNLDTHEHQTYQFFSQYLADFYLSFWLNTVLPASPLVLVGEDLTPNFAIPAGQQIEALNLTNLQATNEVTWLSVPHQPHQTLAIINAGLAYDWYLVSIFKRSILTSSTIPLISNHKFWLTVNQQLIMGDVTDAKLLTTLNLTNNKLSFTKFGLALALEDNQYQAYYLIGYSDFLGNNLWVLISGLLMLLIIFSAIFYYRHWLAKTVIGKAYAKHQALTYTKQQADAANFAKSQFLASMSHEIRTPLYGVISGLELLERSNLEQSQQQQVSRMQKAAQILHTQLTNILDLGKIEQGLMQLDITSFNLRDLVSDCISAFSSLALQKQINLVSHIDNDLPQIVQGDNGKLRQIISNLLSNALKFTPQGGSIIVNAKLLSLDAPKCEVFFSVSDNGQGMLPSKLHNLFNPMVSNTGAGLGLSICQKLAEIMGGQIEVTSQLNNGSKFSFSLNLIITQNSTVKATQSAEVKDFIPLNLHILVAEDNPINCATLNEQLLELGCTAEFAENAEIAVELWHKNTFSALITDVNLPGISGYALSAKIRELNPTIPIIGLSANILPEAVKQGLDNGMTAYCVKPISLSKLYEQLALSAKLIQVVPPNLCDIFQQTMTNDLIELDDAVNCNNLAQIQLLLHRISGALAVSNNSYLADCLHDLEQNFDLQKWQQLRFLLTLLINCENSHD